MMYSDEASFGVKRGLMRKWSVMIALAFGALLDSIPPSFAQSNVVLDWNALMLDAVRVDTQGPPLSSRNFAILNSGIFDAVNSIVRSHQPYRFDVESTGEVSREAAAAGAAHTIATTLYPNITPKADKLLNLTISGEGEGASITNGLHLGRKVGRMALEARKLDASAAQTPYIPKNGPGEWRRTPPTFRPPLAPHWGSVKPFALPDLKDFLPKPPPALASIEYAKSLNEVKALGGKSSASRTREQTEIAVFWSDFSYTSTPPGHWHEIAARIAREKQLGLHATARLFSLLSIAQADAAIVCWESKYRYNFWRPVTAIRRAAEDDNSETEPDAEWDSLLASPAFPSYTSGHSAASAQVLTHFFGTDAIEFSATSDSLPGVVRKFNSFAACADEIGRSRIYGGIHFEFDNEQGKACGKKIGDFVCGKFLLPMRSKRSGD